MDSMTWTLTQKIIAMFLMAIVGYVMTKLKVLDGQKGRGLSAVCLYAATPCAVINSFQSAYSAEKMEGLAVMLITTAVIHAVSVMLTGTLARRTGLSSGEQAAVVFNNAGNLSIPLVIGTLGSAYVFYTSGYLVIQIVLLWTYGAILLGWDRKSITPKKVLLNPMILGIVIGLVLFAGRVTLPDIPKTVISSFGDALAPLAMLSVGNMLAETDLKAAFSRRSMYITIVLRLLVIPLVTIAVLWAVLLLWKNTEGVKILSVALICSIGPSAVSVSQMSALADGKETGYLSSVIAVGTVISVLTMPLMMLLFQMLVA